MKTLVVYATGNGTGNVIMTHNLPYDTPERISELQEYLAEEYNDGNPCALLNLIPLQLPDYIMLGQEYREDEYEISYMIREGDDGKPVNTFQIVRE